MAARIQIINRALLKLGQGRLSSPTDETEQARAIDVAFDMLARTEMRRHAWSFAIRRTALSVSIEPAGYGWRGKYDLPTDLLRLVQLNERYVFYGGEGFTVEGRSLLLNGTGVVYIRYVSDCTAKLDLWDAAFEDAFICRLAAEVAWSLTKNRSLKGDLMGEYNASIREAKRCNAIELGPQSIPADGSWTTSRLDAGDGVLARPISPYP